MGHYPKIKIFFIILIQYNDLESISDNNIKHNNEAFTNQNQFFEKIGKNVKNQWNIQKI